MQDIELNAEAFIAKHKRKKEDKQRLEMKLEMEKEKLAELREEMHKLGYKSFKELRTALTEKENKLKKEIEE